MYKVGNLGTKTINLAGDLKKELGYLAEIYNKQGKGTVALSSNGAAEMQKLYDTLAEYAKVRKADDIAEISEKSLDGVRIINKKYAGEVFELSGDLAKKYPNGVKFNKGGFPDFSPYAKAKVEITGLTGKASDFTKANKAFGWSSKPKGYTWHHVEDGKTLLLVKTELHEAVRHTGGASLLKKGLVP